MTKSDFENLKANIKSVEDSKNKKRKELKDLYDVLTQNEEILDIIILQIGKDIEQKFPGVKFRILARIKSPDSFFAKRENDLLGLVDKKEIERVSIYDIIALSIIIEEVPDSIKANDEKFDSHMKELIAIRKDTKSNLDKYEKEIKEYQNRINEDKTNLEKHKQKLAETREAIKQLEEDSDNQSEIRKNYYTYLKNIESYIIENICNFERRIRNIENDILEKQNSTIKRTKDRYSRENNDCNSTLADYIVRNLERFDNIRALNIVPITKRLKNKENYDGYKATHNCFEAEIQSNGETIRYIFEVQGKSIDAFYIADRGKAAKYHVNQSAQPGKIVKQKKLPDIMNIRTKEQKIEFVKEFDRKVPRFRIYIPSSISIDKKEELLDNGEDAYRGKVYKLSKRECFVLYYFNQLAGNKELDIESNPDAFKVISRTKEESCILPDDGDIYTF